jgi:hypothetical protein
MNLGAGKKKPNENNYNLKQDLSADRGLHFAQCWIVK